MSGKIRKIMTEGKNTIGKKDPNNKVTLELAGVGVVQNHAIVEYDPHARAAIINPNPEDPMKNKTKVNGELVSEPTELKHGDRVLIGNHHYFIYCDPLINDEEMIEWEDAMKEANREQMMMGDQNQEEIQK